MRPALRLLQATATSHTPRLSGLWPTGITGLGTHPFPRPALLSLYNATLKKLQSLPSDSVYRTATESLTKQRLSIVESTKPIGWESHLEALKKEGLPSPPTYTDGIEVKTLSGLEVSGQLQEREGYSPGDEEYAELQKWQRTHAEAFDMLKEVAAKEDVAETHKRILTGIEQREVKGILEPNLSQEQVHDLEVKIGAGLIEEVIEAAYREYELVDTMVENKVWEPLVEKPVEGQWKYFEREKM